MGSSSPLHPYCLSSATHLAIAFALYFLLLPLLLPPSRSSSAVPSASVTHPSDL